MFTTINTKIIQLHIILFGVVLLVMMLFATPLKWINSLHLELQMRNSKHIVGLFPQKNILKYSWGYLCFPQPKYFLLELQRTSFSSKWNKSTIKLVGIH